MLLEAGSGICNVGSTALLPAATNAHVALCFRTKLNIVLQYIKYKEEILRWNLVLRRTFYAVEGETWNLCFILSVGKAVGHVSVSYVMIIFLIPRSFLGEYKKTNRILCKFMEETGGQTLSEDEKSIKVL